MHFIRRFVSLATITSLSSLPITSESSVTVFSPIAHCQSKLFHSAACRAETSRILGPTRPENYQKNFPGAGSSHKTRATTFHDDCKTVNPLNLKNKCSRPRSERLSTIVKRATCNEEPNPTPRVFLRTISSLVRA